MQARFGDTRLVAMILVLAAAPWLATAQQRDLRLGTGFPPPFDPTATSVAMLQQVFRHQRQPWERSRLRGHLPRVSMVAGAGEKVWNLFLEEDGNRLGYLLTLSDTPSVVSNNPYVGMTKELVAGESYESRLAVRIASAAGDLTPDRVLGMALDAADGDYWLAMLTAHNLLKEVTYAERQGQRAVLGWDPSAPLNARRWLEIDPAEVSSKLRNLRGPFDEHVRDKMGPWYHVYGVLFVGGVTSGTEAEALAWTENATRQLGLGSTRDPFKEEVNRWAGGLSHLVNEAVETDLYVPSDLDGLDEEQLERTLDRVIELHRERQDELERTTDLVNDERWGPIVAWQREVLRRFQEAFFGEAVRVRAQLARIPATPPVPDDRPAAEPVRATLRITAVDADKGLPLSGAAVSLAGASSRRGDGPTGVVGFDDLEPGGYRVTVSAPGYEPRSENLAVAAGEALRVKVRLRRAVTGGLRLVVVDAVTRVHVGGYRVRVQGEDTWSDDDGDGVVDIDDLLVGEHVLEISADGYETLRGGVVLKAGVALERTVPLEPVVLPARLEMTIVDDQTGVRIPYALLRYDGADTGSVTAGVDGVVVAELPAGSCRLTLSADGYETQSEEIMLEAGRSWSGSVGMRRLAPSPTREPVRPGAEDSPPGSNQCPPEVLDEARSFLEHNAAQDPSGSVYIRWMGTVQSCIDEYLACQARVKAVYDRCPPDANGSYAECQTTEKAGYLGCANDEIRCTLDDFGCR